MDLTAKPSRVVDGTSVGRRLVSATAYAIARMGNDAVYPGSVNTSTAASPLPTEHLDSLDVETVAGWFVDHYPRRRYPGVVIGSPHGATAHLAAALGMPYLPSAFDLKVAWPRGSADDSFGALTYGSGLSRRLLDRTGACLSVRQVHDPAARAGPHGRSVHLVARWLDLPDAYRGFLRRCLAPGGRLVVVSDARVWPVLSLGSGVSYQVGRVASGLQPGDYGQDSDVVAAMIRVAGGEPDRWDPPETMTLDVAEHGVEPTLVVGIRQWAKGFGAGVQRVMYSRPGALSAGVADVHRAWFALAGDVAPRCVVECGRQLDPWNALRRRCVPYWCENATRGCVAGAEWWLAGSPAFHSIDVVPDAPGLRLDAFAPLSQWTSVSCFGERPGVLDPTAAGAYPHRPAPPALVTEVLERHPRRDLPVPGPTLAFALAVLGADRTVPGLVISAPQA
jgi:hypothetical protein